MAGNLKTQPCKGCGKPVLWAATEDGGMVPLDPKPPVYRNTGQEARPGVPTVQRLHGAMVSHFATCPNANDFSASKATASDEEIMAWAQQHGIEGFTIIGLRVMFEKARNWRPQRKPAKGGK